MSKKIHLLIVDPQNDFCDPKGSLYVKGANEDMKRVADMINRLGSKIFDVHTTIDSHTVNHIAHGYMWVDSNGKNPPPFTLISVSDVENGVWNPASPNLRKRFLEYVRSLERNGRYVLCIWPPHCIIGSWGHGIYPELLNAINKWEINEKAWGNFVTKGSNPLTEHYSALQADVPDPADPSTQINTGLIEILKEADVLLISGEALSHCVASTITDIANAFDPENIKKFVLLEDASSNVAGFEHLGEKFVKDMVSRGMQISTTTDFLK